jgi:putative FmdB family regulatory protein
MPTYEYQCPEGHEFELFQKMSEKPRAKCPVCGKMASRKISGGAGLVFKGSGFYITDYGKDGKGPRKADGADKAGKAEGADSSSSKADKSDSSSKTDSTPAKSQKSHKKKAAE